MFPWLSGLAPSFETYKFTKLVFRYIPSCPSTTDGRVYFAMDYDSNDPAYTTLREFMGSPTSTSCQISKDMALSVPVGKLGQIIEWHYTNTLKSMLGRDRNFSDCGTFQYCAQSNNTILAGDLSVEYTIELRQPQVAIDDNLTPVSTDEVQLVAKQPNPSPPGVNVIPQHFADCFVRNPRGGIDLNKTNSALQVVYTGLEPGNYVLDTRYVDAATNQPDNCYVKTKRTRCYAPRGSTDIIVDNALAKSYPRMVFKVLKDGIAKFL